MWHDMKKQNLFLAMWDCEGLECLFDITDMDGDMLMAKLKGDDYKTPFNLSMLMLRARFNSQRSYEIYTFSTDPELEYDEIKNMFEVSPQVIVDSIRQHGRKIYSDYQHSDKKVIT
jgi:hypothetical protein